MKKTYPMEDYERDGMIDSIRCDREEPTRYRAPETDQKWRARNVISFHFRHFDYKTPPAYRAVLLCAIDHANPTTGRCDIGQLRIARECNLTRETVNRAMRWWEENTYFLKIESRFGRTNAYHILWDNLEADWHRSQERVRDGSVASAEMRGVTSDITGDVTSDITPGVTNDITLINLKENRKEEPHHEMVHSPSARDTSDIFSLKTSLLLIQKTRSQS